jgi:hypothetical protein
MPQLVITIPSLRIPRWGLLLIILFTGGLIALYIWGKKEWHDALVFSATLVASSALILTWLDSQETRGASRDAAKKIAAMRAIETWNSPQFYHCKKNGREVQAYFKAHPTVGEQLTYLKGAPELAANLMDVLNHFEALAIGISSDIIDDGLAKDFFRSIASQYWRHSEAYIKNRRAEQNNTRLFDNFEALYERWKN